MITLEELRLVRARYRELYWQGCVREYMLVGKDDTLRTDRLLYEEESDGYYWPDVDYEDQSRNEWRTARHYNKLLRMLCQEGEEKLRADADFREKALGQLRFWLHHDFKNPNWWHNDIGTTNHMTALGLMLWDDMTESMRKKLLELVARGSMKTRTDIPRWTGANLIWGVGNSIRHALLTEDVELLEAAGRRAFDEVIMGGKEGLQTDASFYQHGPRWYSGGYGANYSFDLSQFAFVFDGTSLAMPREKLDILLYHMLDGQRNMMHHSYFDYNGVGRELTRRGSLRALVIHYAAELLLRMADIPRREELAAFVEQNRAGACETDSVAFATTWHYPAISYLAHNAQGRHIGIKCHAPRQYDMEVCNSEGYLCFNMSYGTRTCYMYRGDEYLDLNAIYDFARMPGTTARKETDEQLLTHTNWWSLPLPNDHVGGMVQDGHGIIFQRPEHDGITAQVSFFTFDGRTVALGADIADEDPTRGDLWTTLDQCHVKHPTTLDGNRVSNGGFTYYNLDDKTELIAGVEARTGAWKRNSFEEAYEEVSGEVFCAYIPVKGYDRYAYAVCPRDASVGARVLSNTGECQAILTDDGILMAVFHTDTVLTFDDKTLSGNAKQCIICSIEQL